MTFDYDEKGKIFTDVVSKIAIHATLHLQGYEHDKDSDPAGMEALETGLMLKLHYPDPYQTTRIANERPRK